MSRQHPLLYEINTRCWLRELSERAGEPVHLGNVPESELRPWAERGFTHIWLMGVWKTGAQARKHSLTHPELLRRYAEILPDWQPSDIAGSPYSVAEYRVADTLGGQANLLKFRERLHAHGLRLILDFVANHLGIDHPWLHEHPALFVHRSAPFPESVRRKTKHGPLWFAHGKDPNFPAWCDTVQLDYRWPQTRAAMMNVLQEISGLCDGVRCDMAMLLLNDVFCNTWGHATDGKPADTEFWRQAIDRVKQRRPEFLFLAEAYWDLEERLQDCGFDYTYNKRFYDGLLARDPHWTQQHLLSIAPEVLNRHAHFLENHDEPRIASRLSIEEHRAAALLLLALPGMRLLHHGQLEGAQRWTPVHLARRPFEAAQPAIVQLYDRLFVALKHSPAGKAASARVLVPQQARPDNPTAQNFVAVQWQEQSPEFDLAVVNLAPHRSQCRLDLQLDLAHAGPWRMEDRLSPELHRREGQELRERGVYLDLPPHGAQLFRFTPDAG